MVITAYLKDGINVKKMNGLAHELATARNIPSFCSGEFWTYSNTPVFPNK